MKSIGELTENIVQLNKEIDANMDRILTSDVVVDRIMSDIIPLVSIGPSGIGGNFQQEF